jgi:hypothetical protein
MLIAKLDEQNKVVKIADYTEFGGFVEIPSDEDLKKAGFRKVNQWKSYNKKTQKLVSSEPELIEPWVYVVKVEAKSEEEIARELEIHKKEIKKQRNILLAETDWIYLPDANITNEEKNSCIEYRKTIREIAVNASYIEEAIWPSKPV